MHAISVTNLSKAYKEYPSVRLRFAEWLLGGYKTYHRLNWILRDIHFSVEPGEAVAIVGVNGAGKSTLLKMITGTSSPTLGRVTTQGRVCALLELGVGFHPEFTGRQNAFMVGQLQGFSHQEMLKFMPEIESFAEIGRYMDQPVRVYSSGMKMRLSFSIATIGRPDVLIVDEALSIGDGYFQHKCYKRIRELIKQGTALLFVSHDHAAVMSICERALLLQKGVIAMEGSSEAVLNYYKACLADASAQNVQQLLHASGKWQTISGSQEASIVSVSLYNEKNENVEVVNVGEMVRLSIVVMAQIPLDALTVGYEIKDVYGKPIFGTNTFHLDQPLMHISSSEQVECNFSFSANLGVGDYSVSVALHTFDDHLDHSYEWRDLALIFKVSNVDKPIFLGSSWLPPRVDYMPR